MDKFIEVYARMLLKAVQENRKDYSYNEHEVPMIVDRMKAAFQRGSYNKDGLAIKWTCKELGIKYTYSAINQYLKGVA